MNPPLVSSRVFFLPQSSNSAKQAAGIPYTIFRTQHRQMISPAEDCIPAGNDQLSTLAHCHNQQVIGKFYLLQRPVQIVRIADGNFAQIPGIICSGQQFIHGGIADHQAQQCGLVGGGIDGSNPELFKAGDLSWCSRAGYHMVDTVCGPCPAADPVIVN